ncbi:MAG: HAMP domain-containing histidine kinase, partial [Rhodobiaceae bacterium]|nr:HAMP domain-containing histidine kinase [Rhodobiaceae bacterium]
SHEVRTPLNAIIGFAEVMKEEQFGAMGNARYLEYAHDIHRSGIHVLSLINDLLDLSKIEAGKVDLTFTGVNLNELVKDCVALMQPDANRDKIIVRTNLPASTPPVVADDRSLRQIMLNVLSNSIKFTVPGGQIIVTTRLNERGEVVLSFRDTGIGMSKSDLETALEPFQRVRGTDPDKAGTGLGLPLTKALVEANRAQFEIESKPGDGTTVRVIFPVTRVLAE